MICRHIDTGSRHLNEQLKRENEFETSIWNIKGRTRGCNFERCIWERWRDERRRNTIAIVRSEQNPCERTMEKTDIDEL